jgi:hypothetical protein
MEFMSTDVLTLPEKELSPRSLGLFKRGPRFGKEAEKLISAQDPPDEGCREARHPEVELHHGGGVREGGPVNVLGERLLPAGDQLFAAEAEEPDLFRVLDTAIRRLAGADMPCSRRLSYALRYECGNKVASLEFASASAQGAFLQRRQRRELLGRKSYI